MSVTTTRLQARNPNPDTQPGDGVPQAGNTRPQTDKDPQAEADRLDKEELLRRVRDWFKASRDHYQPWRQEAAEDFDFVAGHQWSDEDAQTLRDQGRPAVTFNRIQPFVDAISGLEINNRQETQFLPRTVGKSGVNELLTATAEWVRDECDAEMEESEAFRDALITGVGVTQTRMDYDEDADGKIVIERVDPLEIYADPSSRKPNFGDARYVIRVKDIPVEAAEEMFPDFPTADLHARWAEDELQQTRQPHNARIAPYYRIDQADRIDRSRQQCRLVEVEWWDYVTAWRVFDPSSGRFVRLEGDEARTFTTRARLMGMRPQMVKDRQPRYYKAIVGNVVLKVLRGPDEGGFTYKFITAKRDYTRGFWYGLVRGMRDPQMWANKFFTQALHIVNVNAKGGLLAETDAFVDIEEARNAWADSDSIVELNPGGLGRVQQKEPPAFPMQINQLMATSLDAIPATAGVNLEMISMQQQEQPASLEMQRKQQGMTVLAYIFNSKRRYQKEQGRLLLWMIQTFIADGRLIRIGGPENAQYVPLIHDPGLAEYDVVVDDAPTSPNQKERVWALIVQMFPLLRTMQLPPQAMLEFMKYAPFPAAMVQKLSQMAAQMGDPNQNPQMQAITQLNQAKAAHAGAQAQLAAAKAQATGADAQHKQAQAAHAMAESQMAPLVTQSEMDERRAHTELLAAQAVNQLAQGANQFQNAGIAPAQAAQEARMMEAEFQHQQSMDQAGHALEVMKAMQPPPPPAPTGGPGGPPRPGGPPGAPQGMPPPQPPPGPPGGADIAAMHAMGPMQTPPAPGPMPAQPPGQTPFGLSPPQAGPARPPPGPPPA